MACVDIVCDLGNFKAFIPLALMYMEWSMLCGVYNFK
jgi:hypothetical protein